MVDNEILETYTDNENLGNGIAQEIMPTMKGDFNMGRQKIFVTLPSGEQTWITGSSFNEIVQKAINKCGNPENQFSGASESFKDYTNDIFDVFLKPRWKPSTMATNKQLLDKHILPYFSEMPLNEISTATIQKFFQTKQHLSKSYIKQMLIMLHEIFENAVEDKKIKSDPTLSKRITLPTKKTERQALSPLYFYSIVSKLDILEKDDAVLMALLCFTGMRRGEILGLKWDCVHEHSISVCAEVIFKGNRPVYNEYTKSASGIREIPITKELDPYLKERGSGFVLGGEKPYTQCKFYRTWERISSLIDLHGASPHIFRHTYLSIMAASNVDPKTIQALAGHSDFSFTFNKYISKNEKNMQDAGSTFSMFLENLTKNQKSESDTLSN